MDILARTSWVHGKPMIVCAEGCTLRSLIPGSHAQALLRSTRLRRSTHGCKKVKYKFYDIGGWVFPGYVSVNNRP
eukprot:7145407-Pyramimonas_sp.AAC.1